MLSADTIKRIFFLSDKPHRDAVHADDVDIIQFARNVALFVKRAHAEAEHARCVEIVRSMNPDVARALENQRPR